jgi:D-sedoheptulose 7-phosphate isomerase
MKKYILDYFASINRLLRSLDSQDIEKIVNILYAAYRSGKVVYIIGNGGSAATASHFACDLSKNVTFSSKKRFKAISLTDNISTITAYANDFSFGDVFSQQLVNLLRREDVVLFITASGSSENVVRAAEYATRNGAITIGFLGFEGGRIRKFLDSYIVVPSTDYGKIEGVHSILTHMITEYLKRKIHVEEDD